MNKTLIFIFVSLTIVAFSVITLSSAPIINETISAKSWAYENCEKLADEEEKSTSLDDKYKYRRQKTLCERKKAAYSLEYASFIFNIIFGFFCLFLSFLQYFKIGKDFGKNTGLIGLISGIIGFILTFIYFVYSAYIFTNDTDGKTRKLFSNGAYYKWNGNKFITAFEGDKNDNSQYAKYNELGQKQYNYDSDYFKIYDEEKSENNNCLRDYNPKNSNPPTSAPASKSGTGKECDYLFVKHNDDFKNKYLYDKWTTTLIFCFIISICDLVLGIFGFFLFKQSDNSSS
jgi:hypothetical protein